MSTATQPSFRVTVPLPPPLPAMLRRQQYTTRSLPKTYGITLFALVSFVLLALSLIVVLGTISYAWPQAASWFPSVVHGEHNGCPWHVSKWMLICGGDWHREWIWTFQSEKFFSSLSGWILTFGLVVLSCSAASSLLQAKKLIRTLTAAKTFS